MKYNYYNKKRFWWAFACLERDRNKCVKCGSDRNVVVHHIDESRKTGELNNNLENLITLCKKCHAKAHGFDTGQARSEEVRELKDAGMSFTEIGKEMGITRQRVHAIYHSRVK